MSQIWRVPIGDLLGSFLTSTAAKKREKKKHQQRETERKWFHQLTVIQVDPVRALVDHAVHGRPHNNFHAQVSAVKVNCIRQHVWGKEALGLTGRLFLFLCLVCCRLDSSPETRYDKEGFSCRVTDRNRDGDVVDIGGYAMNLPLQAGLVEGGLALAGRQRLQEVTGIQAPHWSKLRKLPRQDVSDFCKRVVQLHSGEICRVV